MIIKNLTRRTASFKQLLNYMIKGADVHDKNSFVIQHNIRGKQSIDNWLHAFKTNEANRLHHRKDSVKLHHTVISFAKSDYAKISKDIAKDITQKYLELRARNTLAVAVAHSSQSHYHIHIMQSGIELYTGRSTRISKNEFASIKRELQEYQLQKYPQLSNSVVQHGKKGRQEISEKEYQIKKRKALTEKERIKKLLDKLYKQSNSKEDFYKRIQDNGLKTYERGGKTYGIEGDRKMRFSTLGFEDKKLQILEISSEFEILRNSINNQERIKSIIFLFGVMLQFLFSVQQ